MELDLIYLRLGWYVNYGDIICVGNLVDTLLVGQQGILVETLKVVMVENMEKNLELNLVPGIESVLIFNSKLESMRDLIKVHVYVLA